MCTENLHSEFGQSNAPEKNFKHVWAIKFMNTTQANQITGPHVNTKSMKTRNKQEKKLHSNEWWKKFTK